MASNFAKQIFIPALARKLLLVSLLTTVFSSYPVIISAEPLSWNKQEISLLKTLWLGSKSNNKDLSNSVVDNPVAINMGHKIFFDPRFSKNGQVSCASCHQPDKYFSDGLSTAKGLKKGKRNTPTIIGASLNTWFFHDGRSDSLWSQATAPLENPSEHGGTRNQFAHIIFSDPTLRQQYISLFGELPDLSNKQRFPEHAGPVADKAANMAWHAMLKKDQDAVTKVLVNVGKVIAAYETQLQPAASRFDNYIKALIKNDYSGMKNQLSIKEIKGLKLFISKGKCITCHSGPMLTDKGFHNISVKPRLEGKIDWGRYDGAQQVIKNPFNCRSEYNDAAVANGEKQCDELDYIIMGRHETFGAMKTPSLRNVSKTAPYMHAGQYKTLKEVLKHYNEPPLITTRQSELFLDITLNDIEIEQIEAFLHSLDSAINSDKALLQSPGILIQSVKSE